MSTTYLPEVRNQYEALPYPERNPEDERGRLLQTIEDRLELINHYCFNGMHDFTSRFRCLVAGAGTGDAVIHLAEQLKHTANEIVYLDMSTASMEVAKERARIRGLGNITWINDSILNIPEMNLGTFDYINCSGVLHHLEDRTEGLQTLASVLDEEGAMSIMVYGRHARSPVYQMQELMRLVNDGIDDVQQKVDNTKKVLDCLPDTNMYMRLDSMLNVSTSDMKVRIYGDAEVYDLFLHSQDNPFSIPEIYQWLDSCNLNLLAFPSPPGVKYKFEPESLIHEPKLLKIIQQLPEHTQQAIAELVRGNMITHTFYVSKKPGQAASPSNMDNVPFLFIGQMDLLGLANHMKQHPHTAVQIKHPLRTLNIGPGKYLSSILRFLDGKRSIREIFTLVKREVEFSNAPPDDSELMEEFCHCYGMFNSVDLMLLRNKSIGLYGAKA